MNPAIHQDVLRLLNKNLKTLNLSKAGICSKGVQKLAGAMQCFVCQSLFCLALQSCVRSCDVLFLATSAGALEVNSDLKSLRLAHNDIGDDGVRVRVYV